MCYRIVNILETILLAKISRSVFVHWQGKSEEHAKAQGSQMVRGRSGARSEGGYMDMEYVSELIEALKFWQGMPQTRVAVRGVAELSDDLSRELARATSRYAAFASSANLKIVKTIREVL